MALSNVRDVIAALLRSTSLWKAVTYTFPRHKHSANPQQHKGD